MSSMKPEWLREAVTDQAVEWFSRHRSGEPLGSAERDEFLAWLRASPLHVQGYLEVVKVAKLIPEALAGLEIGLPQSELPRETLCRSRLRSHGSTARQTRPSRTSIPLGRDAAHSFLPRPPSCSPA